ncbi:MAG: DUF3383 family protein [Janthinobacterium lividum]
MTAGLAVSDVVNVNVTLSPVATTTRNFGAFMVIGFSGVLATTENYRLYTSLTGVGNDFSTTSSEYLAAQVFFSQSPTPSTCYIGQVRTATGETLVAAGVRLAAATSDWYGCTVAAPILQQDSIILAFAQTIEALSPPRAFFYTCNEPAIVTAGVTTDLASTMQGASLSRSCLQYTSYLSAALTSPADLYGAASIFGRIATVDWNGTGTAITLKFQQEPGVQAETLSETQAQTLLGKNCNVFVNYANGAAILQEGVMSSGIYIDERVGMDWLQNALQVAGFNALYNAETKIPQTDIGMNVLATTYEAVMDQAVANGLGAPGVWTGPAFGSLSNGQMLTKGYYVFLPAISTQSLADRGARKAVTAQIALKLAGAVHSSNVVVNVIR